MDFTGSFIDNIFPDFIFQIRRGCMIRSAPGKTVCSEEERYKKIKAALTKFDYDAILEFLSQED